MAPQQLRSATENVATVLLLYSIWQYNEEYTGVDGNSLHTCIPVSIVFCQRSIVTLGQTTVCWFSS